MNLPSLTLRPGPFVYRIDGFSIPPDARAALQEQMQKNMAFIETLPGFLGHVVFEKASGASRLDLVTIAVWESRDAIERAASEVRAYYQRMGWDVPAMMQRWGVEAELGSYVASGMHEAVR